MGESPVLLSPKGKAGGILKKIILSIGLSLLLLTGCSEPDYREHKKVVIRPVEKKAEPVPEVKTVKLVLEAGTNFDFDRAEIRVEDSEKLDEFIEGIRGRRGSLKITGHTDTRGRWEYNKKLSIKRAESVRGYIEERLNIDSYDVIIEGKGESEPLVDATTLEEMERNRRVEIEFNEE